MRARRGFSHWMQKHAELPAKLSDDELLATYYEARKGNHDAIKKLIMCHLRLGFSKVAEFAVGSPSKIEDMSSIMLEKLVEGAHRLSKGAIDHHTGTPNVTGFLVARIKGGLMEVVISKKRILPISKGHALDARHYRDTLEVVNLAISNVQDKINSKNPTLVSDIIRLRRDGFRDAEIGIQLDMSTQRVQQIRKLVQFEIARLSE